MASPQGVDDSKDHPSDMLLTANTEVSATGMTTMKHKQSQQLYLVIGLKIMSFPSALASQSLKTTGENVLTRI